MLFLISVQDTQGIQTINFHTDYTKRLYKKYDGRKDKLWKTWAPAFIMPLTGCVIGGQLFKLLVISSVNVRTD